MTTKKTAGTTEYNDEEAAVTMMSITTKKATGKMRI